MSALSSALAAYLQNSDVIGPLVSGVISGRNFDSQDDLLLTSPYSCIAVIDLISSEQPYIGSVYSGAARTASQIEIRCLSKVSEATCKDLAEAVKTLLRTTASIPANGPNLPFGMTGLMQNPDSDEELFIWVEILTIDFRS